MNISKTCPSLMSWMVKTPATHPLHEVIGAATNDDTGQSMPFMTLQAFDQLIQTLQQAQPVRLETERSDFRKAKTFDELLIVRAELVAGAKLARAGIAFDFGERRGKPQPDLVLRDADLAIEVKSRKLNGLDDLHNELEAALDEIGAPVTVHIACQDRPLHIKAGVRQDITARVGELVQQQGGGTVAVTLEQPWASPQRLPLAVRVFPQPPLMPGHRVFIEGGWELTNHLDDVEKTILAVLSDEQKIKQAESMPTILLVDAARTGVAWIRPMIWWTRSLAAQLPVDTPFIGIAVMFPTLPTADTDMALVLRKQAPAASRIAAEKLAADLGVGQHW